MKEVSTSSANSAEWVRWTMLRWIMPSVADMIFIGLLIAMVFTPLAVKMLGDAGIGWHIRTGQLILGTHAVPHADPFSSSMPGKPWFAWEWLYDVLVGSLEARMGLNGVVWLTAITASAVFAAMFRMLMQRGVNIIAGVFLVLLAIGASTIHLLARPHVESWLFTFIWYWILDSSERNAFGSTANAYQGIAFSDAALVVPKTTGFSRESQQATAKAGMKTQTGTTRLKASPDTNRRFLRDSDRCRLWSLRLWILPVLMLVWVNVHGGFLVGFMLLAIYWAGAVWKWFSLKPGHIEDEFQKIESARRAVNLLWIGVASFVASLINPYGWGLYAHIYSYLTNRFLMDHIEEFQSPNFHGLAQKLFAVILLIVFGTLAVRRRGLRFSEVLIVMFAVYSGLYASRNIPVSSILLAMIVAPLLCPENPSKQFFSRMRQIEFGLRGHLWPVLAVLATFAVAANGGRLGAQPLMDAHFDPGRMPVEAVNYLQQKEMRGPVLSPDFWGGYLIYRLYPSGIYPDRRVIIDDRHDFYGDAFLKSYLKTIHVERGWQDFLREHEVSCLLLPRDSALANVILETRDWKPIYRDEVAIAFVHTSASETQLSK